MDKINIWDFGIIDFIDVFLVAVLLYYIYRLVKGTVAINILIGILVIYFVWRLTDYLNMYMLHRIIDGFIKVGIIALIVVFQPEIRKFLLMVGSTNLGRKKKLFKGFKFLSSDADTSTDIKTIIDACVEMKKTKTGALMVIERNNSLDFLISSADTTQIEVSKSILESIFFKNSPLHDGAIIIEDNLIKGTRVTLPVSKEKHIPERYGLRHKAAVGITEKTDALAIVISEERGELTYFKGGKLRKYENEEALIEMIKKDLN